MRLKILLLATLIALSVAILAPIETEASEQSVQPIPATPATIDYAAVTYTMKMMAPRDLIALTFQDPAVYGKFVRIADRETAGTFDCAADNKNSSAAGLFQTLKSVWGPGGTWGHFEELGISWEDIAGPDCLADVILAKAIYQNSGFSPWKVSKPRK